MRLSILDIRTSVRNLSGLFDCISFISVEFEVG